MRDLRLLLLSGVSVAGVVAVGACAAEMQEPGVSTTGPTSGLTSDSDTSTETSTSASTSTSTSTSTQTATSGTVTTTTNTTGDADDTSTETATTGPLPLGGTITQTSASSSSSTTATTGEVATSSQTSATATTATTATSSGESSTGNGGMGGMTSFGGFTATTTTGGGSCTATPATGAVPLVPDDGWIDCSTNDIGVQGEFFTYSDGTSTITSAFTGDDICVEGTAGRAVSDNSVWGAGFGVNLNQEEREADPDTWNADAMGISGFRFNLSAMPAGTGLRFVYQSGGTDYCVEIASAGAQTVRFSETREACWGSGGDDPNPSTLEQVKWQVTTNSSEHDFSFCITQFAAVP